MNWQIIMKQSKINYLKVLIPERFKESPREKEQQKIYSKY